MERHEMMNRAARCLFGAGTLAAAMLAVGVGHASAQAASCDDESALVCGHVYTETNNNPGFHVGEGTTQTVTVVLVDSSGTPVQTESSNPIITSCADGPSNPGCSYYSFNAPPGTYKVCIQVDDGKNTNCKAVDTEVVDIPLSSGSGNSQPPVDVDPPYDVYGVFGTGTPGYWKNHKEAWPAEGVKIGGVNYLNQATATAPDKTVTEAIALMGKVSGDKTYSMFAALISAKLNTTAMMQNNDVCIAGTIYNADKWMVAHPVGSNVKASSLAWQEAADLWHQKLDDYNNGKLCAPHRD